MYHVLSIISGFGSTLGNTGNTLGVLNLGGTGAGLGM